MNKIGFWPVLAIVTSSQIGTGIFMLPSTLSPLGIYGVLGWLIAGIGAMSLAYVFSNLCRIYPNTGGPYIYVRESFGDFYGFFVGWSYWLISWFSSVVVVISAIEYILPVLPSIFSAYPIILQIFIICAVTYINIIGIETSGWIECALTLIKFIPLIVLPILAFQFFNFSNIRIDPFYKELTNTSLFSKATIMSLWCFIGLESATVSAGSVRNPDTTIPLAVLLGTFIVFVVYIANYTSIVGCLDSSLLNFSSRPYTDLVEKLLGNNWSEFTNILLFIICLGTLNAWTLTTGQISIALSKDLYFPKSFSKLNSNGSPYLALIFAGLGMATTLFFTLNDNILIQLMHLINISVLTFLYIYLFCCFSYIKYIFYSVRRSIFDIFFTVLASLFCFFVIFNNSLVENVIACSFFFLGAPFYFLYLLRKNSY